MLQIESHNIQKLQRDLAVIESFARTESPEGEPYLRQELLALISNVRQDVEELINEHQKVRYHVRT